MGSSNVQTALRCLITGSIFRREKRHVISVKADDVYFHGPPNFSEIEGTNNYRVVSSNDDCKVQSVASRYISINVDGR